jgi:1,4-dihydroxy-2-naphthoate octaprenyltransferase
MCIGIFFLSINGILSNNNIAFSFIIFVIGILFFIYGIIYTIKNKSINYFIFTPFLLIMFCIVGTYYGQIPHNRINEVADEIKTYDQEHDGIDFDVLLNKINVPKKMDIIKENGEIIIFYKDFIFFVNRNRYLDTDYFIDIIKENNVIINDNKDLVYYVLKEGYLETNNK